MRKARSTCGGPDPRGGCRIHWLAAGFAGAACFPAVGQPTALAIVAFVKVKLAAPAGYGALAGNRAGTRMAATAPGAVTGSKLWWPGTSPATMRLWRLACPCLPGAVERALAGRRCLLRLWCGGLMQWHRPFWWLHRRGHVGQSDRPGQRMAARRSNVDGAAPNGGHSADRWLRRPASPTSIW